MVVAASSIPSGEESVRGDLDRRSRVHDAVVDFYREVVFDDLLGPVFEDVAEVDWSAHIPRLISYWCQVLLGEPGYAGFVLEPHRRVHDLSAFSPELFDRWTVLWRRCVDAGWSGPMAERAKEHADRIARVLARRLLDDEWVSPVDGPPAG